MAVPFFSVATKLRFLFNSVADAEKSKPREREPSTSSSSSGPYDDADNVSDESENVAASSSSKANKVNLDYIQQFFADKLRLHKGDEVASSSKVLKTVDFTGLIDHWKEKGFKKIVTMVGAGISTCECLLRMQSAIYLQHFASF